MASYGTSKKRGYVVNKQKHINFSHFPNASFDIVTVAASLGGLKALIEILSALPANFPAAITVVQHLDPQHHSQLAEILDCRTLLKVKQAEEGDILLPGIVYIAAPNKHLLVNLEGILFFSDSERVNFVRPSADVLFESVATAFKQRAIAVVLTGRDGDGARGVLSIKKMGGKVIAQDQPSCVSFSMPNSAINTGSVDFVLPLNEIASALVSLVMTNEEVGSRGKKDSP
jgi:two-component system chemotaxis response regulator CheB